MNCSKIMQNKKIKQYILGVSIFCFSHASFATLYECDVGVITKLHYITKSKINSSESVFFTIKDKEYKDTNLVQFSIILSSFLSGKNLKVISENCKKGYEVQQVISEKS